MKMRNVSFCKYALLRSIFGLIWWILRAFVVDIFFWGGRSIFSKNPVAALIDVDRFTS